MIEFNNIKQETPFQLLKEKYELALNARQKNIEAITISSFNSKSNEVDSRNVNLKFINEDEFIFFSNYNSPKSQAFKSHRQIAALFFWSTINVQIRIRAVIKKTSREFNKNYFFQRGDEKNALAISSNQSNPISSYNAVLENFNKSLKNANLRNCPNNWGGYSFKPYEIEFWEGNKFRLNKRDLYKKVQSRWNHFILEP